MYNFTPPLTGVNGGILFPRSGGIASPFTHQPLPRGGVWHLPRPHLPCRGGGAEQLSFLPALRAGANPEHPPIEAFQKGVFLG